MLKMWFQLMRTESVRVNNDSRLCGAHFPRGQRTISPEIPSAFLGRSKRGSLPPVERYGNTCYSSDDRDGASFTPVLTVPEKAIMADSAMLDETSAKCRTQALAIPEEAPSSGDSVSV